MAAPSRKSTEIKRQSAPRKTSVRLANAHDQAAPSPFRQWHDTLHEQWAQSDHRAAAPAKWSQRRTLAFIAATCGGFWVCVIFGVSRLAH